MFKLSDEHVQLQASFREFAENEVKPLAKELDIHVVTEGVEQKDQLQYMQELGCTLFQGYYFAKPMPVNQFEKTYF